VWFWRPDAGVKSGGFVPARRRWQESRSPRRARSKPLKPLRREGRTASAEPVCSCASSFIHLHARPRVQRAPGLPCSPLGVALRPLLRVALRPLFGRAGRSAKLARNARRDREGMPRPLNVIASEAKQSNSSLVTGLLRFASLAMTILLRLRIGINAAALASYWNRSN
jgi:hypothetical protein